MPIYDKSTKELMRDWASKNLEPGQVFSKSDVVHWFSTHYPKIKSSTVSLHVEGFATNNGRHRSHHNSIRPDADWDLFYKVEPGKFRLFQPNTDPAPVYDLTEQVIKEVDEGPSDIGDDSVGSMDQLDAEELREFAYERDLQNFLAKNIELIEPGMRLYEDEGFQGVEFPAGGRRIDLLAVDNEDRLVVIELKASRAYDRVVGQTARYMAWVKQNIDTNKTVRGIIIAHQITEDLRLAASISEDISLMEYKLKFEVKNVSDQRH
ncbi:DUF91 domain-containing protein [Rhodobacteraceae bacterium F11138]|nr:DUF91 domain-containing protein [Rhodobacteraceae bacterium F11138]